MISMLREKKGYIVVYPEYFDARLSRSEGRMLRKELCVENPSVERIEHALKKLKIEYEVEREKHFPSDAFRRRGRVLVKKTGRKIEILQKIARALRS